jgi:hypothetical protein
MPPGEMHDGVVTGRYRTDCMPVHAIVDAPCVDRLTGFVLFAESETTAAKTTTASRSNARTTPTTSST